MANHLISYLEAKAKGLPRYFTGKPCLNGHLSDRWVSNCACRECQYDRTNAWGNTKRGKNNPGYYTKWQRAHPDSVRLAKRRWYLKDPKRRVKVALEWAAKNIENRRAATRNRIARRKSAVGSHTAKEILQMLRAQNWKCVACGISIRKKRHIDHIMPLTLGGSNYISNLQGLCPTCNCRKNAKDPFVWARELGITLKI